MPIVIDLLAEYHDQEEARRRDPVKRTMMACATLVGLVVLWCVWLQIKVMTASSALKSIQAEMELNKANYDKALVEKHRYTLLDNRLSALNNMTTNRFLWANVFNALQGAPFDQIQIQKLITSQAYQTTAGAKPDPTATEIKKKLGTASSSTSQVKLILEGRDYSEYGDKVESFRLALSQLPYFKETLGDQSASAIILKDIGPQQQDLDDIEKVYVQFTLEFNFPPKTRELMPYE